jgi:tetratricopeptide (TPR) repeat protein
MKFLRWVGEWLPPRRRKPEAPTNLYQILQKAHAHLLSGDYDKARDLLLEAIGSRERINEPETIEYILISLSSTWLLTEKFADGIVFFSEYVSHYPEDSTAYGERAAAFWYTGRLEEAIRDYSRALELRPTDILSLSGRGQVLAEAGELRRAMEDLNLALQTLKTLSRPDSTRDQWYEQIEAFIHNGRGFALAGLGESGPASEEFAISIKLSPENAWVYHNRAQVYDRAGSGEKACEDYQKSLTKKHPALSPNRKAHAQARVRELSNRS